MNRYEARAIDKLARRYTAQERKIMRRHKYYQKRLPEIRAAQLGGLMGLAATGATVWKGHSLNKVFTKANLRRLGKGILKGSAGGAGLGWILTPSITAYKARKIRERGKF